MATDPEFLIGLGEEATVMMLIFQPNYPMPKAAKDAREGAKALGAELAGRLKLLENWQGSEVTVEQFARAVWLRQIALLLMEIGGATDEEVSYQSTYLAGILHKIRRR